MRGGSMPTTMAANPDTAKDILELLDKGYDILHISFFLH